MNCEVKVKFSFLKLFNTIKGVSKPVPDDAHDSTWLEAKADQATKDKFDLFAKWCDENGVWHPKVKYPVMFGKGDNQYPGLLAVEPIGKNETFIRVPSKLLISTKKAYECDPLK